MDWNRVLQLAAESLASAAGLIALGAAGWLMPLARHWLEVEVGLAEAAQIQNGLNLAVKVTETQLGLDTPEKKLAFAQEWARGFFADHNIQLDSGKLVDRLEASLLTQKMLGMNQTKLIPLSAIQVAPLTGGVLPA